MNDSVTIKFKAKGQTLTNRDKAPWYASNTIDYVYAEFDLDTPWKSFSTVSAVWHSGENTVATLLDTDGKCMVPPEVLDEVSQVSVNLVGSTEENGVVTARLTTFPALALTVHTQSLIFGSETEPVTASQFEQFVDKARNMVISQVVAVTLATGLPATATYSNGVLTLGLPKGDTGATGATPAFSIGTVTTGDPGTDASATISGTDAAPVLNLQIPRGNTGETGKSAYQYAVEDGYEGTEGEFRILMGDLTTAVEDATDEALISEGYAVGKQRGADVGSSSPYYENNSKYYSEQAAGSATSASGSASSATSSASSATSSASSATASATSAASSASSASTSASGALASSLKAEGYAVGKQNGSDVESGSTYYHNNAKYYSDQAAASATSASGSAASAGSSATSASSSATSASSSASAASTSASNAATSATAASGSAESAASSATSAAASAEAAAESAASLVMDTELDEDSTNAVQNKVITAALATKAEEDGYYEEMSVGNAEQLISSIYEEDQAPYLSRPTAGALEVGDRAYMKTIVGGTVAWNQLVKNGNFSNGTNEWITEKTTASVSDGVCTITVATASGNCYFEQSRIPKIAGHKYLASVDAKEVVQPPNGDHWYFRAFYNGSNNVLSKTITSTSWRTYHGMFSVSTSSTGYSPFRLWCSDTIGGAKVEIRNAVLYDLTAMLGSTIADYVYSLEQTTAGSGIAKLKEWGFDIDSYHAYQSGSLESVNVSAHETVGFNQWDEEWESGYINSSGALTANSNSIRSKNYNLTLPNTTYYCNSTASGAYLCFYTADYTFIERKQINSKIVTSPSNAVYFKVSLYNYGATYGNDICINISSDRNGEYEPYVKHSYPLDSDLTLRGIPKLDASNNLYYDGDVYEPSGSVTRKYGIVDLGTLDWNYASSTFYASFPGKKTGRTNFIVSGIYTVVDAYFTNMHNLEASGTQTNSDINFKNSAYTDTAAFKTAMSGVYLVYELETETTETADTYRELQIVDNYGTEEFVDYAYLQGDRDIKVPAGHVTRYTPDLVSKLEELPNPPSGNGDYIMRRSNGTNAYTPLIIPQELPNTPSEDGTYKLVCTVSDGTATLSWESEV